MEDFYNIDDRDNDITSEHSSNESFYYNASSSSILPSHEESNNYAYLPETDNLSDYSRSYEPDIGPVNPTFYPAPSHWLEVLGIFPTEVRGTTYFRPLFYYVPVYDYPLSNSDGTHIIEISEISISPEVPPAEISETTVNGDRNLEQVHSDDDSGQDEKVESDSTNTDDDDRVTDDDGSNSSWFDVSETADGLNPIDVIEAYDEGICKKNVVPIMMNSSHNDGEDRSIEAGDSNSSWLDISETADVLNANEAHDDGISKKKDDSYLYGDEDRSKEAGDFNLTWYEVRKKSDVVHQTDENQGVLGDDSDKKNDNNYFKDDEDHNIQANALSSFCFDVSENTIDEEEPFLDDSNGKEENDIFHNNADVREMQMDDSDVTEKGYVVNPIQEDKDILGEGSDKKEHDNSLNKDEDDDPVITLADILASEEYWKVKRKEYWQKRRSRELYRSALEGEIRPRKNLPDVGTLPTIFEDLPYPVNHPYDAGEDTFIDEYFDLKPLEVKKSESSSSAVVPKKKRFRNTRKMFSRMFRCFKPKTLKESKPP